MELALEKKEAKQKNVACMTVVMETKSNSINFWRL